MPTDWVDTTNDLEAMHPDMSERVSPDLRNVHHPACFSSYCNGECLEGHHLDEDYDR